ncbi:amino acid permease [Pelomyxa schiedti]|nr:amino acid permease [Pelomyxa schiedti]
MEDNKGKSKENAENCGAGIPLELIKAPYDNIAVAASDSTPIRALVADDFSFSLGSDGVLITPNPEPGSGSASGTLTTGTNHEEKASRRSNSPLRSRSPIEPNDEETPERRGSLEFIDLSPDNEVITAIPLNGGVYNILQHCENPLVAAALASVLMILSSIATAVVSAATAAQYLHEITSDFPISTFWLTLLILFAVSALMLLGVRDSSIVSLIMFTHHIICIIVLCIFGILELSKQGTSTLKANWELPSINGGYGKDLWLGFSAAMLGVTGFETSANYVESQKKGVYPKCLRNMWAMSTVQNVLVMFLITALVDYSDMKTMQYDLVAALTKATNQNWLTTWLRVNATIVCIGGVITGFVGCIRLGERLVQDRVLPGILMQKNRLFHTSHWVICAFWLLTSILFAVTGGNISSLAGMFTASFLTVLFVVACGNLLFKYKRRSIPKFTHCHWTGVVVGGAFILLALIGNVYMDSAILLFFFCYFCGVATVVVFMVFHHRFYSIILHSEVIKLPVIRLLNERILDLFSNEFPSFMTIIVAHKPDEPAPVHLKPMLKVLDDMYPRMVINLMFMKGTVSPPEIDVLSKVLRVPKNFIFIPCPTKDWPLNMEEAGGVRIVTN